MSKGWKNGGRTYGYQPAAMEREAIAADAVTAAKAACYRTAIVARHVVTDGGAADLPAGEVVGVRFRFMAWNQVRRAVEPVYAVTRQGGAPWGDMYGNCLRDFVL